MVILYFDDPDDVTKAMLAINFSSGKAYENMKYKDKEDNTIMENHMPKENEEEEE